jgi:S1-C subfamily serine protease
MDIDALQLAGAALGPASGVRPAILGRGGRPGKGRARPARRRRIAGAQRCAAPGGAPACDRALGALLLAALVLAPPACEAAADQPPALPAPAAVLPAAPPVRSGPALAPDELYARLADAVWSTLAGADRDAFRELADLAQGSAVAVAPDRLLTNCHLLTGREVVLIVQGDAVDVARLIAADTASDRCVLAPEARTLRPVEGLRPYADLRVGERVFTIGSPSGLERTWGEGLISGLRRQGGVPYVQTTAPISQGSSGGGLFDVHGNLIGITSFLLQSGQQLNFALAAESFWPP